MKNTLKLDGRPFVNYKSLTVFLPPLVNNLLFLKDFLSSFKNQEPDTRYQLLDLKLLPELSLEAFKKLFKETMNQSSSSAEGGSNRVIILSEADILFPLGPPPFLYLQHLQEQNPKIFFIFLIQQNLLTERLYERFFKISLLFKKIIYLPLEPGNLPFKTKLQAKNFFLSLNENQRLILRLLVRGTQKIPPQLAPDQEYLERLNVVKKHYDRYRLISPLLEQAALEITAKEGERLIMKNNKIYIGKQNITQQFSPSQRKILGLLLKARSRIVSRERIAKELWGKNWQDKYSDWAIDQMISKLRKKLSRLWINPEVLVVKKKKGIFISQKSEKD